MTEENRDEVKLKDEGLEDIISGLPDDILVNIISRLSFREAVCTCVLSTRWKDLWTFITILNFDALDWLRCLDEDKLETARFWYVYCVYDALQFHRGCITKFKVAFDLDAPCESDINNWIYTVLLKRVQKIELKFPHLDPSTSPPPRLYAIPQTPCFLSRIKSLKSLCLDRVNVTGEILEFFICNCPYLEKLRVYNNESLLRLKVVGSLLRMKYLRIRCCQNLEELEISCTSLLSFKYFGPIIKFSIKNVTGLVDVSIAGNFQQHRIGMGRVISQIESYLPQLETLEFDIGLNEQRNKFPKCQLPALRRLTINVRALDGSDLLDLTCLMKSCPFLQKLKFGLYVVGYSTEVRSRHQYPKCSHEHLKVVELFLFCGNPVELELALYLLENTTTLEKFILSPGKYLTEHVKVDVKVAIEQAKKLEEVVPPRVELVIG